MEYNQKEVDEIFEIVFNLSAKEIYEKIEKVRNRKEIAQRRWFWELLQNAKDAVNSNERVSVKLTIGQELDGSKFVLFEHNGNPFKYNDARNLVFPYSDKSDEENSDKSGKFGTGFLATHILSNYIQVKGILTKDNNYHDFTFRLDRSGMNKTEISQSINNSWQQFKQNQSLKENYTYSKEIFDTSFKYFLTEETEQIALNSLNQIELTLPFVLSFIPKVANVLIKNNLQNEVIEFKRVDNPVILENGLKETTIETIKNGVKIYSHIFSVFNNELEIAISLKKEEGNVYIREFEENQPNIFCPFPLIGSDNLNFPVIINSENFIPKEERDGIWLSSEGYGLKNQPIFQNVTGLYSNLLNYASKNNWQNTFVIFKHLKEQITISDFDNSWFEKSIQDKCKTNALVIPLVYSENGEKRAIESEDVTTYFPNYANNEIREKIWDFTNKIVPNALPMKSDIHKWYSVMWDDFPKVDIKILAETIAEKKNLKEVSDTFFGSEPDATIAWIDSFIGFVNTYSPELLNIEETKILPNQSDEGQFCLKDSLFLDDDTIDEKLKDVLGILSKITNKTTDWRTEMLNKDIYPAKLNFPYNRVRNIEKIGIEITELVKEMLKNDSPSNEFRNLFSTLLNWLNDNSDKARKYFKGLKTDSLLYKSADASKIKYVTEMMQLDRDGKISLERQKQILSDPNLELKIKLGGEVLAEREKKQIEFQRNLASGKIFEDLFKDIVNQYSFLSIEKIDGEQDYIITNNQKLINNTFYIEMKSINSSESKIELTPPQAKKAAKYNSNYFLCVVPHDNVKMNEPTFKLNARFDSSIGKKLIEKINLVEEFEKMSNGINVYYEDNLLRQYNKYRYKFEVDKSIWGIEDFNQFIERIKN